MAKSTKSSQDWMTMMEDWFMKLPALPKGGRDGLVTITPWICLIFGILGVLAGLAGFGILTAFSPFVAMGGGLMHAGGTLISAALGVVASVLLLMAFPGTKAQKMQGWKLLFWSEAANALGAIIALSLPGVIWSAVAFYLLFQIKSYYK